MHIPMPAKSIKIFKMPLLDHDVPYFLIRVSSLLLNYPLYHSLSLNWLIWTRTLLPSEPIWAINIIWTNKGSLTSTSSSKPIGLELWTNLRIWTLIASRPTLNYWILKTSELFNIKLTASSGQTWASNNFDSILTSLNHWTSIAHKPLS